MRRSPETPRTAVRPVPPPQTAAHGSEIVALAVTSDGAAAVTADRLGGIRLWPSFDGTREPVVIQSTEPRSLAHWSSADVAWTPAGELVVQFSSGLAKVDLATGALTERTCGWGFGLSDQPPDGGRGGPTICEVGARY